MALKILLSQTHSTLGNRTQNKVSNRLNPYKVIAEVVTGSLMKMVNMSVISVITIILQKVVYLHKLSKHEVVIYEM